MAESFVFGITIDMFIHEFRGVGVWEGGGGMGGGRGGLKYPLPPPKIFDFFG